MSVNDLPKNNDEIRAKYFENKKKEFEDGCFNQNQSDACFCLAEWYQVVGKDNATSSAMYADNCLKRGHYGSCYNLAIQLLSDKDKKLEVPAKFTGQDSQEVARGLLEDACEVGKHPVACLSYASMLLAGAGGKRDIPNAIQLLSNSCNAGNDARACVKLGTVYLRGNPTYPGVEKDAKRAFEIMRRACDDLGHPNGCQVLAVMYKFGDGGVAVDLEKSKHYQQLTKELSQKTGEKLGSVHVDPNSQ